MKCQDCPGEAEPGKTRCAEHLEADKARPRARVAWSRRASQSFTLAEAELLRAVFQRAMISRDFGVLARSPHMPNLQRKVASIARRAAIIRGSK